MMRAAATAGCLIAAIDCAAIALGARQVDFPTGSLPLFWVGALGFAWVAMRVRYEGVR